MIKKELEKFIDESENKRIRNKWIDDENMKVYVRKGYRLINKKMVQTLDIASIAVDEDKRRMGFCSKFLEEAHELNPWDATFVECVLNQNLACHLLRNGWNMKEEENSFYKLKKEIKEFSFLC